MNKRQAKKAFKKKYGMTPKEAAELIENVDFKSIMQQATETINKFAEQLPICLNEMCKKIRETLQNIDTEQLETYLQQYEENRNETAAKMIDFKEREDRN